MSIESMVPTLCYSPYDDHYSLLRSPWKHFQPSLPSTKLPSSDAIIIVLKGWVILLSAGVVEGIVLNFTEGCVLDLIRKYHGNKCLVSKTCLCLDMSHDMWHVHLRFYYYPITPVSSYHHICSCSDRCLHLGIGRGVVKLLSKQRARQVHYDTIFTCMF